MFYYFLPFKIQSYLQNHVQWCRKTQQYWQDLDSSTCIYPPPHPPSPPQIKYHLCIARKTLKDFCCINQLGAATLRFSLLLIKKWRQILSYITPDGNSLWGWIHVFLRRGLHHYMYTLLFCPQSSQTLIDFLFLALPESSGAGTFVQLISATDGDLTGTFDAKVTYSIEDTNTIFGIEPETGDDFVTGNSIIFLSFMHACACVCWIVNIRCKHRIKKLSNYRPVLDLLFTTYMAVGERNSTVDFLL